MPQAHPSTGPLIKYKTINKQTIKTATNNEKKVGDMKEKPRSKTNASHIICINFTSYRSS